MFLKFSSDALFRFLKNSLLIHCSYLLDSETKIFILEMLIAHKTESIEMPVQGGDAMNAEHNEDSIALTMAMDESLYEK